MGTGCEEKLTLVAATGNKGKLIEIREILSPYFEKILSAKDVDLNIDVVEDADTFLGNAMKKAKAYCEATGMAAVADDSGLCVDALNGEPGVYSARYMGEGHTDAERTAFVLEKIRDVPEDKRSARFMCAAVVAFPDGTTCSAVGTCEGRIAFEPIGENGFGYDPVFVPVGETRTFAQMRDEGKNAISHRGRAMRALCERIEKGERDE